MLTSYLAMTLRRIAGATRRIPAPGLRLIALCLFLWPALLTYRADAGEVVEILLTDQTRHYQALADALADGIRRRDASHVVNFHYSEPDGTWPDVQDDALLVTIGSQASAGALRRFPRQRQLSLFITQEVWGDIAPAPQGNKAAIFIDQPPERLLALARVLAPDARTYATLFGPASSRHQAELEAYAKALDVTLASAPISLESNPLTLLTPLIRGADLFVAIPESGALSRNLAKWVLHLAFKHKRPVIGFSKAYTDAGGTASLYTANEDISRQALAWLDVYLTDPQQARWQTFAPTDFTISTNPSVVRILKLNSANEQELHRQVQQLLDTAQP